MGVQKVLYSPYDEKTRIQSMLTRWYFAVKRDAKRTYIRQNKVATTPTNALLLLPYVHARASTPHITNATQCQHAHRASHHNINSFVLVHYTVFYYLCVQITKRATRTPATLTAKR